MVRILVEEVTGLPYHRLLLDPELVFSPEQFRQWSSMSEQLLAGTPLQYVLGKAWFADMELLVSPDVLIPRPETEELAVLAKTTGELLMQDPRRQASLYKDQPLRILDIGTGSGCLAIYLARHLKPSSVSAVDLSSSALSMARENGALYKVSVEWLEFDILQADEGAFSGLDLIVSNPPYIPQSDRSGMEATVLDHEPGLALFVSNEDPLIFYRHIAKRSKDWLHPWGSLHCEIHAEMGPSVAEMTETLGLQNIAITTDLQGRDRFLSASLSSL